MEERDDRRPREHAAPDAVGRSPSDRGFTLIEMIVVLVVLALLGTLVVARGPSRSAGLETRGAAAELAGALRLARTRAIAADRPVAVVIDPAARAWSLDGAAPHVLPPGLAVSAIVADGAAGSRAAVVFAPDGSSTGGRIELSGRGRRLRIGVEWLTGRVEVAGAP